MGAMAFLLRAQLPDRPGSLGALAVVLGSVGADIISFDVVERGEGFAVDDIVVDVPSGTMPDALITAAESLDGVQITALRPFSGILDAGRELELVEAVASAGSGAIPLLADRVPAALRVGWALVVHCDGDRADVVARSSAAPGSPAVVDGSLCAADRAQVLSGDRAPEQWTALDTAVAAAPLDPGRLLVVGRPGGPEFRDSELARLGYFTGILATVLRA